MQVTRINKWLNGSELSGSLTKKNILDWLQEEGSITAKISSKAKFKLEILNDDIGIAEFPDSITERGSKHLKNLSVAISQGYRSVMLYVVQRMDCEKFTIAKEIDPIYAENFINAKNNGVEMEVWACDISTKEIKLSHQLQFT